MSAKPPAAAPCVTCPYRRDVPSGVWAVEEYAKLPPYDGETREQPPQIFLCHQQDGRACAGWVGCHDMENNLALRFAASRVDVDAFLDYESPVLLFGSGQEAAEHGLAGVKCPDEDAVRAIKRLEAKRSRSNARAH